MARRKMKLPPAEQPFVVKKSKIAGKGAFASRTIEIGLYLPDRKSVV